MDRFIKGMLDFGSKLERVLAPKGTPSETQEILSTIKQHFNTHITKSGQLWDIFNCTPDELRERMNNFRSKLRKQELEANTGSTIATLAEVRTALYSTLPEIEVVETLRDKLDTIIERCNSDPEFQHIIEPGKLPIIRSSDWGQYTEPDYVFDTVFDTYDVIREGELFAGTAGHSIIVVPSINTYLNRSEEYFQTQANEIKEKFPELEDDKTVFATLAEDDSPEVRGYIYTHDIQKVIKSFEQNIQTIRSTRKKYLAADNKGDTENY